MKKGICILPFVRLEIQPEGSVYPCCHSVEPTPIGQLHKEDLMSVWHSKAYEKMRSSFHNSEGEDVEHCKDCFFYESVGAKSWRKEENENWSTHLNELNKDELDYSYPRSLSIRFSNLCNFSCRTCRPSTSTAWFKDAAFLNPKGIYKKIESSPRSNPLSEQILPIAKHLEHVHFTGGEPLLEKEHYKILKILSDLNPEVDLSYDTNLSVLSLGHDYIIDLLKNFKKVNLCASSDGFGKKGEYIRRGMNWADFVKNWHFVRKNLEHITMSMNFTLGITNMFHVMEFVEELLNKKIFSDANIKNLRISLIEEPKAQSLQTLPHEVKQLLEKRYEAFVLRHPDLVEVAKDLRDAVSYMNGADTSGNLAEFRNFNRRLDLLRGESFQDIFPEEAKLLGF